jgi:hypothetical protein
MYNINKIIAEYLSYDFPSLQQRDFIILLAKFFKLSQSANIWFNAQVIATRNHEFKFRPADLLMLGSTSCGVWPSPNNRSMNHYLFALKPLVEHINKYDTFTTQLYAKTAIPHLEAAWFEFYKLHNPYSNLSINEIRLARLNLNFELGRWFALKQALWLYNYKPDNFINHYLHHYGKRLC